MTPADFRGRERDANLRDAGSNAVQGERYPAGRLQLGPPADPPSPGYAPTAAAAAASADAATPRRYAASRPPHATPLQDVSLDIAAHSIPPLLFRASLTRSSLAQESLRVCVGVGVYDHLTESRRNRAFHEEAHVPSSHDLRCRAITAEATEVQQPNGTSYTLAQRSQGQRSLPGPVGSYLIVPVCDLVEPKQPCSFVLFLVFLFSFRTGSN